MPVSFPIAKTMNIVKGDYVVAEFPNSCFRLGGTVLNVINVNGQPPQYVVLFVSGCGHHTFTPDNIVQHIPKN